MGQECSMQADAWLHIARLRCAVQRGPCAIQANVKTSLVLHVLGVPTSAHRGCCLPQWPPRSPRTRAVTASPRQTAAAPLGLRPHPQGPAWAHICQMFTSCRLLAAGLPVYTPCGWALIKTALITTNNVPPCTSASQGNQLR